MRLSYLNTLSDGVERGEVGVDGGDVPEEGRHGGVVVVLKGADPINRVFLAI